MLGLILAATARLTGAVSQKTFTVSSSCDLFDVAVASPLANAAFEVGETAPLVMSFSVSDEAGCEVAWRAGAAAEHATLELCFASDNALLGNVTDHGCIALPKVRSY